MSKAPVTWKAVQNEVEKRRRASREGMRRLRASRQGQARLAAWWAALELAYDQAGVFLAVEDQVRLANVLAARLRPPRRLVEAVPAQTRGRKPAGRKRRAP